MSCREFEKKGYLYLFGELTPSEETEFENHLNRCSACRNELEDARTMRERMGRLSLERPGSRVRKAVLAKSRRRGKRVGVLVKVGEWTKRRMAVRPVAWGVPVAAVVLLLLALFIRFPVKREAGESVVVDTLEWQDDFFAQADWIDNEIERVGSGELLSSYFSSEQNRSDLETWYSPVSGDLSWIRGEVENLTKTIFGL